MADERRTRCHRCGEERDLWSFWAPRFHAYRCPRCNGHDLRRTSTGAPIRDDGRRGGYAQDVVRREGAHAGAARPGRIAGGWSRSPPTWPEASRRFAIPINREHPTMPDLPTATEEEVDEAERLALSLMLASLLVARLVQLAWW